LPLGIQFSSVGSFASPRPYAVTDGRQVNDNNVTFDDFPNGQRTQRPSNDWENWYKTVDIRLQRALFTRGTQKLTLMAEQAAAFGFQYEAEDDYGVAETTLTYRIDCIDELLGRPVREGQRQLRIDPPLDRVRSEFTEIFNTLEPPLAPGDRIVFSVTAKDNNTETGPGLGRSQPVEIIVVAPDLAAFTETGFGFGGRTMLAGLSRVKRQTNLLIEPDKAVRTEEQRAVEKQDLKAQVSQESWPSGSEDSVGQYFQILSEGK
jgi:hypothetical protein